MIKISELFKAQVSLVGTLSKKTSGRGLDTFLSFMSKLGTRSWTTDKTAVLKIMPADIIIKAETTNI